MSKKLLIIAGPTASGKTALGIELAKRLDGEIVSADSMQIYRGMDVGTAKATPEEQREIPHHLLDILEPGEMYSVSRYVEDAAAVCETLFSPGKQPVVVGGTGLYIDSLLAGRRFAGEAEESAELRGALSEEYDRCGGEEMLRRLGEVDPERAAKLAATDRRRIIRALEVYALTGRNISEHDLETRQQAPAYDALYTVLEYADRKALYERIESRVDRMCEGGLYAETQSLLEKGISDDSTCMQAIGYRQAAMYLRGELSEQEARALIKQATRRYAKRQLTWFRRHTEALRLQPDRMGMEEMADKVCRRFLEEEGNDRN